MYWLIKREAASSIPAPKWARTPLGNNRVIPETEEEEAIQGDLRLMGAKTDWGADVS
ncbi:hypothetical protein NXW75_23655 [Bacteroides xylanisolvens]|nr:MULTISPECIES: hypothetical protein [Bacteroidales]MCS3025914.1 hypothetical protein [Bacteroides xylanisolvens]MRZ39067.1 hypothetical protein [Parabacteroides distasonis]UWG07692.1 MAG: hypothetical protein [Bacteriophage sp.]